jgi:hypothetical protein
VRHALAIAAMAASVIVPIACGSDSSTSPDNPTTPVGAYSLTAFNGKAPPVTLFSDTNYSVTLSDASLSLTAEGNYQATTTVRETVLGHISVYADTTSGTWIQGTGGAGALVFTDKFDGRKVTATWSGLTITLTDTTGGATSSATYKRK